LSAVLLALALATLLGHLATAFQVLRGNRSIRFLNDLPPLTRPLPRVSIIIPARNEERNLEEALRSVLALDYDNLEIDVVDDRSTDRTGEVLDRLAAADPRLRVVHVRELPPGWLGKNHALWLGAAKATGEFLLFTDADVVIAPSALRRAVGAMTTGPREDNAAGGLDHLTASPDIDRPSALFEMFIGAFSLFFALFTKPWKVKDPRSPHHVGIGAFNLVRAAAYRAVGGHRTIAMRPDDDLKLGKLLKKSGYRQEFVFGRGAVRVEWYASVRELIQGLMKNAFAGVDYRISVVVTSTVILLTIMVWPFLGIFLTAGAARWLNLASALVLVALCWINAPLTGVRRWHGIGFPLATLLFLYIVWRAMLLTLWHDGIDWRGTHYPLAELKANKV
jgi:glycosyltransferase involved in cell wall biosynthesis